MRTWWELEAIFLNEVGVCHCFFPVHLRICTYRGWRTFSQRPFLAQLYRFQQVKYFIRSLSFCDCCYLLRWEDLTLTHALPGKTLETHSYPICKWMFRYKRISQSSFLHHSIAKRSQP